MNRNFGNARRDENEKEIIAALQEAGAAAVVPIDSRYPGTPDLMVVSRSGKIVLMEVKSSTAKYRRCNPAQLRFMCIAHVYLVRTPEEATRLWKQDFLIERGRGCTFVNRDGRVVHLHSDAVVGSEIDEETPLREARDG